MRIIAALLLAILALPAETLAQQTPPNGKKMLWTGLAMVGGGVGLTVYGTSAKKQLVPRFENSNTGFVAASVVATVPAVIATTCVSPVATPSAVPATTVCTPSSTIVGYDETGRAKWSIIAPAVGAAVGGSILALYGGKRMKAARHDRGWKLAVAGTGAGVSYTW